MKRIDGCADQWPDGKDACRRQLAGKGRLAGAVDAVDRDERGTILACRRHDHVSDRLDHRAPRGGVDQAVELRTDRLILRRWRESDLDPFARMNADPEVMRHFLSTLTRAQSDGFAARIERQFDELGYGPWAVEIPGNAEFIGFVGLLHHTFRAHFTPATEVG